MKNCDHSCGCSHQVMVYVLICLIGLLFLLGNLGYIPASIVNFGWPLLVVLMGLLKLGEGNCDCCKK